MAIEYKVGDVVRLKSNGPSMTVTYLHQTNPPKVDCVWFVASECHQVEGLPAAALRPVNSMLSEPEES